MDRLCSGGLPDLQLLEKLHDKGALNLAEAMGEALRSLERSATLAEHAVA